MIATILFWCFSLLLLGAAFLVITAQNPVKGALSLVLCFFAATGLWLLLSAEFLALTLILVYVGAVMTLFLFVVMTINIDFASLKPTFLRYYLPLGLLMVVMLAALLIYILSPTHASSALAFNQVVNVPVSNVSNVVQLGNVLYTRYALEFEIAAVILLVAIIAAISLTMYEPIRRKQQSPAEQINVKKADRVRLVNGK